MASSAPRGLRSDHVVTVGIALFSMLFGAGNLIIPPLLALQAGSATPVAMLGFLIAAIGLPVMGFIAVALAGTARELAGRVPRSRVPRSTMRAPSWWPPIWLPPSRR